MRTKIVLTVFVFGLLLASLPQAAFAQYYQNQYRLHCSQPYTSNEEVFDQFGNSIGWHTVTRVAHYDDWNRLVSTRVVSVGPFVARGIQRQYGQSYYGGYHSPRYPLAGRPRRSEVLTGMAIGALATAAIMGNSRNYNNRRFVSPPVYNRGWDSRSFGQRRGRW